MHLLKGQKCKISDLTANKLLTVRVSARLKSGEADIACFGVDSQDKLSDDRYFVFYNQTSTPEHAISMKSDAQGSSFSIDFTKLPAFIKKLVVTIAADENTLMRDITSGELTFSDGAQTLADFSFSGDHFAQEKALILCEIYEKDGVWRLSVVASGFNGGLNSLLTHFGGEEAAPASAPTPPVPVPPAPSKPALSPSAPAPTPAAPAPSTPIPAPAAPSAPVSLRKSGDTHKISLTKNGKEIHVNLNWNMAASTGKAKSLFGWGGNPVDLDLACMFRLKTGQCGVIQALGNAFGCATDIPYIFLDQDDRSGTSQNGENMWFKKPELVDFAVVFAYIYEGTPNWGNTNAAVTLKQQGSPDIEIRIDNKNNRDRFCVIASMTGTGDQLEIRREERFFAGHKEVDNAYGFGFQWKAGRK